MKCIRQINPGTLPNPLGNNASTGIPGAYWIACALFLGLMYLPTDTYSQARTQADKIPHVDQKARQSFVQYTYADMHKAFAIAPGGTWAWTESENSADGARTNALQRCQKNTDQRCVLYSLNDEIVFDAGAWARLWRAIPDQVRTKTTGVARGARFPNLRFSDANGKQLSISNFSGKITLVHFWGSWCPPCLREMPALLKLQAALKQQHGDKIAMVLLQVREPYSSSSEWAKKYRFDTLPLYDSGVTGGSDATLKTVDGKPYPDRKLARAFPTSYVLDENGTVLFSHNGPITNWAEYVPFFTDVVNHSKSRKNEKDLADKDMP